MRNDPHIADLSFPSPELGVIVTFVDPWFVNAYGNSFMGGSPKAVATLAHDYGIDRGLPHEDVFPFQVKE